MEQWQKVYSEFGSPTLPAFHPLAVGNVLLMRTIEEPAGSRHGDGKAFVGGADGGTERTGVRRRKPIGMLMTRSSFSGMGAA